MILIFFFFFVTIFAVLDPSTPRPLHHHDDKNTVEHNCIHDEMLDRMAGGPSSVTHVKTLSMLLSEQSNITRFEARKRAIGSKIRIFLDVSLLSSDDFACFPGTNTPIQNAGVAYTCTSDDRITDEKRTWLVDTLLKEAEEILENALYVDPVVGNLIIDRDTCGFDEGIAIPSSLKTEGKADTDIIIWVTGRPIATQGVLAFGGECSSDSFGRAIAGQLNYSPSSLKVGDKKRSQIGTTLHEISHVLGFSKSKWSSFYDHAEGQFKSRSDVIGDMNLGFKTTEAIKTPGVQAFVSAHFACNSTTQLIGGELEDGGSSGTAGSHWEKRVYFNEYMTGSSSSDPVFSKLTLLMFNDSGWYTDVDLSVADPLIWGNTLGCNFAVKRCNETSGSIVAWPTKDTYPGYFCTESLDQVCAFDLRSKARCGIENYSPPPEAAFRYFPGESSKGGLSSLADYCPYYSPSDFCVDDGIGVNGEEYGPDSRCFENTLNPIKGLDFLDSDVTTGLGCYKSACSSNTVLKVAVDSVFYDCPPGQAISVDGMTGSIICPSQAIITAVCTNAVIDISFPVITHIDGVSVEDIQAGTSIPSGGPGSVVKIEGDGFQEGATVDIHGPATSVEVTPPNLIMATVPSGEHFYSPTHLLAEKVSVVVANPNGLKLGIANGYEVSVDFDWQFIVNSGKALAANPLYAAIGGLAVLCAYLCCIYCCCSGKKSQQKESSYRDQNLYR